MKKQIDRKKIFKFLTFLVSAAMLTGCVVYRNVTPKLSEDDIVQMSKEGMSSRAIISEIRNSRSVYMLHADQIAQLSREGVPDSVLNYMDQTRINAIRRYNSWDNDYYYGPYSNYWYSPWWPYGYWGYGYSSPLIIYGNRGRGFYHGGEHFHGGGGHYHR